MPDDHIQASVGMHHDGSVNCFNLPKDVATIIGLLNSISDTEGGTSGPSSTPLGPSASPRQLFEAILKFQQKQNDAGRTPRLSVDGHVDPGAATLARLNEISHRAKPAPPSPPLLQIIPFSEAIPMLIAQRPHSLTKSDLDNTPSTPALPSSLAGLAAWELLSHQRHASTADLENDMRRELFLEPFRKVVESKESDVIHCRAPESMEGARCGNLNTGERRSAAACDIPAI
jgi:hypothetical protein